MSTLTPVRTENGRTVHLVAGTGLPSPDDLALCGRYAEQGWYDAQGSALRMCLQCGTQQGYLRRIAGATR